MVLLARVELDSLIKGPVKLAQVGLIDYQIDAPSHCDLARSCVIRYKKREENLVISPGGEGYLSGKSVELCSAFITTISELSSTIAGWNVAPHVSLP